MPEPVPTVIDLTSLGEAWLSDGAGGTARYRVSDEGHARMGAAMRRNGLEARGERNG